MTPNRLAGVTSTKRLRTCILEVHRVQGSLQDQIKRSNQLHENNAIELSEIKEVNEIIQKSIDGETASSKNLELKHLQSELEDALRECKLVFVNDNPTVDESSPERIKFKKRLEMLRLKAEETKYRNLTQNLGKVIMDDEKTNKSMMYASSIGLNMIVAPISFGIFVYIFAGQFINFDDGRGGKRVQSKRVIASVLGGVFMLFVEMILYVIRSHQLDEHVRKKKSIPPRPFGHDFKGNPSSQQKIKKC